MLVVHIWIRVVKAWHSATALRHIKRQNFQIPASHYSYDGFFHAMAGHGTHEDLHYDQRVTTGTPFARSADVCASFLCGHDRPED